MRCNASANKVRLLEYHQKMDGFGHQHHNSSVYCYLSCCQAQVSAIHRKPLWSSNHPKSNISSRSRRRTFGVHSLPRVAPGRVNAIYKFMKCIGIDSQSERRCAFLCTALVGSDLLFFIRLSVRKKFLQKSVAVCGVDEKTSCTIMYAFSLSFSLSLSLSSPLYLSLSLSLFLSLFLSVSLSHSPSIFQSISLTLSSSISLYLTLSLHLSLPFCGLCI